MQPLSSYYQAAKDGGLDMTKDFYDLGLTEKHLVVEQLEVHGLIPTEACGFCVGCLREKNKRRTPTEWNCREVYKGTRTLHRLASAMLQHSLTSEKAEYPCSGVRTLSRKARAADDDELNGVMRWVSVAYKNKPIPWADLVAIFNITEEDYRRYGDPEGI